MPTFEIGPDKSGDLRTARPYFLIPLLGLDAGKGIDYHRERVVSFIKAQQITDVFVISHGWHRNFFSGVGAYDRLLSRFTALSQRGRLQPKNQPFRPLFLAMHWNSDPEEDGWVDTCGRRSKDSFLTAANELFEPTVDASAGLLRNTFEDIYEFMTYISAPDVSALDRGMDARATTLFQALVAQAEVRGRLGTGPQATPEEKSALIWRCYQEAAPQRVLLDQSEAPQAFANPLTAITNLLKFLIAVLGLVGLLGAIPAILRFFHFSPLGLLSQATEWLRGQPETGWVVTWVAPPVGDIHPLRLLLVLTVTALLILGGTIAWQQGVRRGRNARGLPVLAVGSWVPLQVLFTLPSVVYLFATFLFRTPLVLLALVPLLIPGWYGAHLWLLLGFLIACLTFSFLAGALNLGVGSLFDERTPARPRVRDGLAWIARHPIRWFRLSVARDSSALALADGLDKQLAFWEMQRKAAQAGEEAGRFLDNLLKRLHQDGSPALDTVRIHLIGHSFGGLLLSNTARYLAGVSCPIDSLILLQAAMGSAWFAREAWCRDGSKLRGVLACIYSAYDMANGFYYPAANNGRVAAGYVGLCQVGDRRGQAQCLGKDGLFASLSQPPDLAPRVQGASPYALNLDASRLIYQGALAAGGGHDDVYKDDVIHMLWAITQL